MGPTRVRVMHRRPTVGLDFGFKHVYLVLRMSCCFET